MIRAVMYDQQGFVLTDEEFSDWCDRWDANSPDVAEEGPNEIAVVTGTALPVPSGDFERGPGTHFELDVIAEWDVFSDEPVSIRVKWARAQSIAKLLNGVPLAGIHSANGASE